MRSAREDIKKVESWGFSRGEALGFVTRRAVAEARRVANETRIVADRATLEEHLRYLAELKALCQASSRRRLGRRS